MSRARSRLALLAWISVVAAAVLALHKAGSGELATPPLGEPAAWGDWLIGRDPVVAAMAILRLVALAAVWYLLLASVAGTALRLVRADGLVSVADRLTVPSVRRLLVAAAGVTLASGLSPNWAGAQSSTTTTTTIAVDASPPPTLTMRLLPSAGFEVEAEARTAPSATWTVRPGECFWSIAEDVLTQAWARAPSDAEIVPYWRVLIEENRDRLGDRENEDLIFPGQVFSVPSPSP